MDFTRLRAHQILPHSKFALRVAVLLTGSIAPAAAQTVVLQLDPTHTSVRLTLDAALHTVHGTFQLRTGKLQFDPASGKISGEIVVDAKSGDTGNGMRDRKMHKDVLESEKHPEIKFRPDRVEGTVATQGKSSVKVHGLFSVHGADHEILVPAEIEMNADHWTASAHFTIPYAQWGIKNPSTFFLHVSDSVEIEIAAAGSVAKTAISALPSAQ